MTYLRISFLFIFLGLFGVAQGAGPQECIHKLNPRLIKTLKSSFPAYRLPTLRDLDQESIRFDMQGGADGCFAVAAGDFDGDQRGDSAVLLAPVNKKTGIQLVVALRRGKTWAVRSLPTFCETVEFCYVKAQSPGIYTRSAALDGPVAGNGERMKIKSKTQSVLSGTLESTAIVYVHSRAGWRYVWVSD